MTSDAEKAKFTLDPALCGAAVVRSFDKKFGPQGIEPLILELDAQIHRLRGGDMSNVEAMLFAQATALQAIFVEMATRAQRQERMPIMQAQLSMALKAQAQCRATISALADLKYPRQATFVTQSNIAHGPQQVNNGIGAVHEHAENTDSTNKLSGGKNELLQDTRASGSTIKGHPNLATLEKVHRAKVRGG